MLVGDAAVEGGIGLGVVEPGLHEQRTGVLTQRRHGSHRRLDVAEGRWRQQRLDYCAVDVDAAPPLTCPQLLMVDDVGQRLDVGGGDPGRGEARV